jgi:hypothetical protein
MPIRITCPGCRAPYTVADALRGQKVLCRECGRSIAVDGGREAALQHQPRPQSPLPPQVEAVRPPPLQRKRKGPLLLGLAAGCLMLLLLALGAGGALAWWWWPRAAEADGDWPVANALGGPAGTYPPEQVVTLHVSGVEANTREAILEKLTDLVGPGRGYSISSAQSGDRLTVLLGPVSDPKAFAGKIDFGTVRRVSGRTVTVAVAGPPPANADAVAKALHGLKSPNAMRRAESARQLKDMLPDQRRAEVAPVLESLLSDPNPLTRDSAAEALGVWGGQANVPALLRAMNDVQNRRAAMLALGRLKDGRAAEPLASRLEDLGDRQVAAEALKAMGPAAEQAVLRRLGHHDEFVRVEACRVLKVIGTRASLPALQKAVAENDFFVAPEAKTAAQAITARQ